MAFIAMDPATKGMTLFEAFVQPPLFDEPSHAPITPLAVQA
jgi:hypothetical protein